MRCFLPLALLALAVLAPIPAPASAVYAPLEPDSSYMGGMRGKNGEMRVEVHLLDGNFFVLRHRFVPEGKTAVSRDITGNWRQLDEGSLLQLANRQGLLLHLNVGGAGNLYGDFRPAPDGFPQSLVLKKAPRRSLSFNLMGRLDRRGGRASLTDSATGRVFSPVTGAALAALPDNEPLFVDVEALPVKNGLVIREVRSFSSRLPSDSGASLSGGHFADAAGGHVWRLPLLPGLTAASCIFRGGGKERGTLEVAGRGLHLTAAYEELHGRRLAFAIRREDGAMLRACGARALLAMLAGTPSWSVEGEALILTGDDGRSFLLEKSTPRTRAH